MGREKIPRRRNNVMDRAIETIDRDAMSADGAFDKREGGGTAELCACLVACRESLIRVAARIINDRETALDIVHDVFVSVLEKEGGFDGRSSLKTYLYRIVINKSIDARRRRMRGREVLELYGKEFAGSGSDPHASVDNRDLVRRLLAGVPDKYRIPLILAEVDGMSYDEIGETLRLSANTARTRVFRCRERLRALLEKNGWMP
jgi:RNA polymerase sigma-70 factor, ECF subfamily